MRRGTASVCPTADGPTALAPHGLSPCPGPPESGRPPAAGARPAAGWGPSRRAVVIRRRGVSFGTEAVPLPGRERGTGRLRRDGTSGAPRET